MGAASASCTYKLLRAHFESNYAVGLKGKLEEHLSGLHKITQFPLIHT